MSVKDLFEADKGYVLPLEWSSKIPSEVIADKCNTLVEQTSRLVFPNLHFYFDWINEIVKSEKLLEFSRKAIGNEVAIENTFLVYKKPGDDFEIPLHQDGIDDILYLEPGESFSFWLAITDANESNGGLIVYPGSHKDGYLDYGADEAHKKEGAGTPIGITKDLPYSSIRANLKAGQAIAMNSALIHSSGMNYSGMPRIGLNVRITNKKGVRKRLGNPEPLYVLSGQWGEEAFSGDLDFANPIEDFRQRIYRKRSGG